MSNTSTRKSTAAAATAAPAGTSARKRTRSTGAVAPETASATAEAEGAPAASETAASTPKGKLGMVVAMLLRPEGATVDQLMEATGWQAHSVRGAIAGSVKKKLGLNVSSEKTEAGRVYRIVKGAGA